ncbi:thiolase family protein [Microlunatus parietis]|uniref:Acetyl-CoA acyltransferase n=1 Tax=Microlunatus parietis TaxID=682979 RepID=A0A7Y9IF88_9ACTN|nr:acetyl-CoA C-acyltransferase [Microlunatus parietis]NYE75124.1 acetyl-CoA acyltransferase [Microlunatus parietis]
MHDAVIVDVIRTGSGRGKPGGALSGVHPVDLLAGVLAKLVERNGLDPTQVDDVIAGCVSQAGEQTFNLARNAALAAGFPITVPGVTIDRQCGSSQQAAHFAAQGVIAGGYDIVIACGVESMSRVPMGSPVGGRDPFGPKMAERFAPGLVPQGISAELIAARWGFDRDAVDGYAAESHRRAAAAAATGRFDNELVPVPITAEDGTERAHTADETIRPATTVEGLAGLKPSFYDEATDARFGGLPWLITPGNSSPLTDGASAALIMSERRATELGLRARARFVGFAVVGDDPIMMLTGPIPATHRILERTGLSLDRIDAYEVNEAFAPVPLAWAAELHADPERLNPCGGAIALGHPLGASGTKLLATLVNHLEATGGRYGLQTMCEGGGMANAMIIERL